jgi:hypothetical protein
VAGVLGGGRRCFVARFPGGERFAKATHREECVVDAESETEHGDDVLEENRERPACRDSDGRAE